MSAYRREYKKAGKSHQRWAFRKVIRLPDGTRKALSGTPAINTKAAAENLERQEIEKALHPERFAAPKVKAPTLKEFAVKLKLIRSLSFKLLTYTSRRIAVSSRGAVSYLYVTP